MTAMLFDFPAPAPVAPKGRRPKPIVYSPEFLAFWNVYPPRFNSSKLLAAKAWERLTPAEQEQAMVAVPIFTRSRVGKEEEYTPHAASWLNGKYFETIAVPQLRVVPAAPIDWPAVLRIYNATGRWNPDLGPEPGKPGCKAPA